MLQTIVPEGLGDVIIFLNKGLYLASIGRVTKEVLTQLNTKFWFDLIPTITIFFSYKVFVDWRANNFIKTLYELLSCHLTSSFKLKYWVNAEWKSVFYWVYDKYFVLLLTCPLSWMVCLLLAEWRERDKENNIVSDSDIISVLGGKCLHTQSPVFVQGYQIIVHVITSLH